MSKSNLESVGMIAARRSVSCWAVSRAIARAGVKEVARFGTTRAFDPAGVRAIDQELDRVESKHRRPELASVA